MFQFTRFAAKYLCIQYPLVGESRDQRLFVNYPRLFADFHALHRLLMPRHPPYTLNSLTTNIQLSQIDFDQVNLNKPIEGESSNADKHRSRLTIIASFSVLLTSQ